MNTIKEIAIRIILPILSAIPVQRIAAAFFNKWLQKMDSQSIAKARKTAQYLREIADLSDRVLEGGELTDYQTTEAQIILQTARLAILEKWAKGISAKKLQQIFGRTDEKGAYVEE